MSLKNFPHACFFAWNLFLQWGKKAWKWWKSQQESRKNIFMLKNGINCFVRGKIFLVNIRKILVIKTSKPADMKKTEGKKSIWGIIIFSAEQKQKLLEIFCWIPRKCFSIWRFSFQIFLLLLLVYFAKGFFIHLICCFWGKIFQKWKPFLWKWKSLVTFEEIFQSIIYY